MKLNEDQIAQVAHEVNRAYCDAMGDDSQDRWEHSPDWQKSSAVDGVRHLQENPLVTPRELHENWMRDKQEDGWAYGDYKDPDRKKHPCMIPYQDLPQDDKVKDYLFSAVVKVLTEINEETEDGES